MERVLELSGYGAALAREDSHESQERLENLAELRSAAVDYEAREEAPSLAGFLDRAALLSETDRLRDDVPVVLMTLHNVDRCRAGSSAPRMQWSPRQLRRPSRIECGARRCRTGVSR